MKPKVYNIITTWNEQAILTCFEQSHSSLISDIFNLVRREQTNDIYLRSYLFAIAPVNQVIWQDEDGPKMAGPKNTWDFPETIATGNATSQDQMSFPFLYYLFIHYAHVAAKSELTIL